MIHAWKCNNSQVLVLLFKGCKHDSHELHSVTFLERARHLLSHQLLLSGLELLSQLDPARRLSGVRVTLSHALVGHLCMFHTHDTTMNMSKCITVGLQGHNKAMQGQKLEAPTVKRR